MRGKIIRIAIGLMIAFALALAIHLITGDGTIAIATGVITTFMQFAFEWVRDSVIDLVDTTNWKSTRRKLARVGRIDDNTLVRISFAYLYRIKLGNRYLLVKNERGTHKFQPVGGVYKMKPQEKSKLKNLFGVTDDDKVPIDESSRDDYRLYVPSEHLPRFVKRFDREAMRERIANVGREFREELVDTGILAWDRIEYRYCGRHMTDLQFEHHFQTYELLLADIVELLPSSSQLSDLKDLAIDCPSRCHFASSEEIRQLGVDTEAGELGDTIATHTFKMLQEEENGLMKPREAGKTYRVKL